MWRQRWWSFAVVLGCAAAQLNPEWVAGYAAENKARYREAAEAYERAIQGDTTNGRAHEGLVRSLIRDRRFAEAEKALERAEVALAGQGTHLEAARGHAAYRRGQIAKAEQAYRASAREDAKNGQALLGLARIYSLVSKKAMAERFYRAARAVMLGDSHARLAWASALRNVDEHIQELESVLATFDPETEVARNLRTHLAGDRGLKGRKPMVLKSPYRESTVRLEMMGSPGQPRGFGLKVTLNAESVRLLLDTGASGISVTRKTAERLKLEQLESEGGQQRGIGSAAAAPKHLYLANRLRAGGVEFENVPVSVAEKVADVDGLIGTDVFEDFLITLDLPEFKMHLLPYAGLAVPPSVREEAHDAVTPAGFTQIFRQGHLMLIPGVMNEGTPKLFLIDTGSNSNLVDQRAAQDATKVRSDSSTIVRGVQGAVTKVYKADRLDLRFAGFLQENLGVTAIDMREMNERIGIEISGILGTPVLARMKMTIDYRNGGVRLEYKGR